MADDRHGVCGGCEKLFPREYLRFRPDGGLAMLSVDGRGMSPGAAFRVPGWQRPARAGGGSDSPGPRRALGDLRVAPPTRMGHPEVVRFRSPDVPSGERLCPACFGKALPPPPTPLWKKADAAWAQITPEHGAELFALRGRRGSR